MSEMMQPEADGWCTVYGHGLRVGDPVIVDGAYIHGVFGTPLGCLGRIAEFRGRTVVVDQLGGPSRLADDTKVRRADGECADLVDRAMPRR